MKTTQAISQAKLFRQKMDILLQEMKLHRSNLCLIEETGPVDKSEAIEQHILSIRDLESAIMRQGMALRNLGNPSPYTTSKDPSNPSVDPVAEGLTL